MYKQRRVTDLFKVLPKKRDRPQSDGEDMAAAVDTEEAMDIEDIVSGRMVAPNRPVVTKRRKLGNKVRLCVSESFIPCCEGGAATVS